MGLEGPLSLLSEESPGQARLHIALPAQRLSSSVASRSLSGRPHDLPKLGEVGLPAELLTDDP